MASTATTSPVKSPAVSPRRRPKGTVPSSSMDDSSDSDGDEEVSKALHRRVSTSKQLKNKTCIKEGYLMKQTSSFQRWRRRYFKLKGSKLYYAKESNSHIFEEVDLRDLSVAENSTKNVNNTFRVITPFRSLILCAYTRKEMEEWISALKSVANKDFYEPGEHMRDMLSGMHNWYACSHARPTYCNVCREALSGVTSHGLSCEVCKCKAHKRCAVRAQNNCKWTTLASIGKDIIEEEDGTISMPHQWMEGNVPVSAKCAVCDKTCGSVLRLQDLRCLWCRAMIHIGCKGSFPAKCSLGDCRLSLIPPPALNSMDSDGYWQASKNGCGSPLLVFVNSKSGDNQGVKFLRRFRQLLNPVQVFDLMNGGPYMGLRLFQNFTTFRILVCGGDGSIGWVLSHIDKMDLHKQCQIGVLPLGTGNDLARVLGWGTTCDDDAILPAILEKLERASTKMLDRWSLWTQETPLATLSADSVGSPEASPQHNPETSLTELGNPERVEELEKVQEITEYENSVANHLTKILQCGESSEVISSAEVLCETVRDFVAKVGRSYEDSSHSSTESQVMKEKCDILNNKLDLLLKALREESHATVTAPAVETNVPVVTFDLSEKHDTEKSEKTDESEKETKEAADSREGESENDRVDTMAGPSVSHRVFKPRDALMSRANSLKKAVRQIIEQTEKAVDEQNAQTQEQEDKARALLESVTTALSSATSTITTDTVHLTPKVTILTPSVESLDQENDGHDLFPSRHDSKSPEMTRSLHHSAYTTGTKAKIERKKAGLDTLLGPSLGRSNPMLSKSISGGINAGGLISKVLLANADALCAAASPLMDQGLECVDGFTETCVMNNYLGIGMDAKISLDFHTRREEHPEKCRSRKKNIMWYGMRGGKELLHRTYRNLEQKVHLECDGQRIPLPTLQGIVVLNIASYGGGGNFWGTTKEDDTFTAPSFDDHILEVVAVFGSVQMAVSRMITLHHHRIAQCRVVKITVLGKEGVPVQVDGEAWVQPPGVMKIVHKNRAQMLVRDKAFENTLKSWKERKITLKHQQPLVDEEMAIVRHFCESVSGLIESVKLAAEHSSQMESELLHLAMTVSASLDRFYSSCHTAEGACQKILVDVINSTRGLHGETTIFLAKKSYSLNLPEDVSERLNHYLTAVENDLRKVNAIEGISLFLEDDSVDPYSKRHKAKFKFPGVSRFKKPLKRDSKSPPSSYSGGSDIKSWSAEEVATWLESISLEEYASQFIRNDIRGSELLCLERRDLKDIGVTKVGHIKRLQHAIKDLQKREDEKPRYEPGASTSH
ncbi:diacylglycerol kinase delta-like isoform X3 [Apostichopus japonicus]|uniref:diacylglycerol kinase delta-like isoform X3 n=1 Tax=Stichopus japonicus TaxID=307972 RepID=UPI003AB80B0E